jgi:hypothetical protein
MRCPDCGCEEFYCKDPDDQYEVYQFGFEEGRVVSLEPDGEIPEIDSETEMYCNMCAWHGKQRQLGGV